MTRPFRPQPWILNMWLWPWPLAYFWKTLNIGHNFFILWKKAFIFGTCVSLWQGLSNGTKNFEHVTLTVTFYLLLKNFNIGHNFFILWDRSFHIWHVCSIWRGLFNCTINFEHVTLTVTFDLLLKNFNIGHNFFILRDRAFIFGVCVPYDKAFLTVT